MKKEKDEIKQINNYINKNFYHISSYEEAISCLKKFDDFLKKYSISPTEETISILIEENNLFNQAIELVCNQQLSLEVVDQIEDNDLLKLAVEVYYETQNVDEEETIETSDNNEDSYTNNAITTYLNEIGRIPLLTREEEKSLAIKVAKGDEKAKELLINSNLRLVVSIAKRYQNRGLDILELIQEGNIGLMIAAEKYDVTRDVKFASYAGHWIKSCIGRSIEKKSRNIKLSANMYQKLRNYTKAKNKLKEQLKREPTTEEIKEELGVSLAAITQLQIYQKDTISINSPVKEDETEELEDFLISPNSSPDNEVIDNLLSSYVSNLLEKSNLTEKELDIIKLRFGLNNNTPMTLEEIGEMYNNTRERIRQIQNNALKKLQIPAERMELDEYIGASTNNKSTQTNNHQKVKVINRNSKRNKKSNKA